MDSCIADECDKPAEPRHKFCRGHRKREALNKPLTPLREWGRSADVLLEHWALKLADAKDTSEGAYRLARKKLRWAAVRYAEMLARTKVPTTSETDSRP